MIILAIDPGTSMSGFAILRYELGEQLSFIEGGQVASLFDEVVALFTRALMLRADVREHVRVAVERPHGKVFDAVRGASMISVSNVAGGIAWAARAKRLDVVELSAQQVRAVLVPRTTFKQAKGDVDRAIKAALPSFVKDLPKTSNSHVRDAIAVGICAAWSSSSKRKAS